MPFWLLALFFCFAVVDDELFSNLLLHIYFFQISSFLLFIWKKKFKTGALA